MFSDQKLGSDFHIAGEKKWSLNYFLFTKHFSLKYIEHFRQSKVELFNLLPHNCFNHFGILDKFS